MAPSTPSPWKQAGRRDELAEAMRRREGGEGTAVLEELEEGVETKGGGEERIVKGEEQGGRRDEEGPVSKDPMASVQSQSTVSPVSELPRPPLFSPSSNTASTSSPVPSADHLWEQVADSFPSARLVVGRGADGQEATPEAIVSFLLTVIKAQQVVIREQREANSVLRGEAQLAWESGADLAAAHVRDRARLQDENRVLRNRLADSRIIISSLKSRRGGRKRLWDWYEARSEAQGKGGM